MNQEPRPLDLLRYIAGELRTAYLTQHLDLTSERAREVVTQRDALDALLQLSAAVEAMSERAVRKDLPDFSLARD